MRGTISQSKSGREEDGEKCGGEGDCLENEIVNAGKVEVFDPM